MNTLDRDELLRTILQQKTNNVTDEDFHLFSERTPKELDWLWKPYILRGNLNMIVGDGGVGKSYVIAYLLAAISSGAKVPFKCFNFDMERAILQNAEDDIDATILPRLLANGANTNNIGFFDEDNEIFSIQQLERLEERLKKIRPAAFVLDPVQAYLGDVNMNAGVEVRNCLKPLKILAQKYNCAIILVMHLNKNMGASKATNRVMGSYDFVAACRSVILIEENPENPGEKLFTPLKTNLMKEGERNTLSYKITDSGEIKWLENKGYISPNELLLQSSNSIHKGDKAREFIMGVLSRGEIKANEFKNLVINVGGVSEKCYNETKARMVKENLIKHQQKGNAFYWKLVNNES